MPGFFDYYDPLERRYIFNSFLVVAALVEVLILVVTLIWQIDDGWLVGGVREVPFPWKEYLLVSFAAPIALIFLFGVIVRGFEACAPEEGGSEQSRRGKGRRYFLALAGFLLLLLLFFQGSKILPAVPLAFKTLGLGGTYLLVALVALACLYFPLRLLLNYRLQKKALQYQYLAYLAERHGLVLPDPKKLDSFRPTGVDSPLNLPDRSALHDSPGESLEKAPAAGEPPEIKN